MLVDHGIRLKHILTIITVFKLWSGRTQLWNFLFIQVCFASSSEPRHVKDMDFAGWYESDWLSNNLRTEIHSINFPIEESNRNPFDSSDSKLNVVIFIWFSSNLVLISLVQFTNSSSWNVWGLFEKYLEVMHVMHAIVMHDVYYLFIAEIFQNILIKVRNKINNLFYFYTFNCSLYY